MKNKFFKFLALCLSFLAFFITAALFAAENQEFAPETEIALKDLPGNSEIPLEKYDTTTIVEVPVMSPSESKPAAEFNDNQNMPKGSSSGMQNVSSIPPVQDPQQAALQNPVKNALAEPEAQVALQQAQQQAQQAPRDKKKKQRFGLKLDGEEPEEESDIPPGTLAVYIDIEEAFNNNPWTIKARKNIKIDLEAKQLEYVQMQSQLQELRNKLEYLNSELAYYTPYYHNINYISALGNKAFPILKKDDMEDISKDLIFSSSALQVNSPINIPLKNEQLKNAIFDTKKAILQKEAFLVDYKELSKEEILSRQDYIVQQILKQIYSGIKEYATVRNIGIVVDKKDLIFGKPLNVTPEFIKWMKTYNKKYIKENGDIL